jgi:hypothetical protein
MGIQEAGSGCRCGTGGTKRFLACEVKYQYVKFIMHCCLVAKEQAKFREGSLEGYIHHFLAEQTKENNH